MALIVPTPVSSPVECRMPAAIDAMTRPVKTSDAHQPGRRRWMPRAAMTAFHGVSAMIA